MEAARAAVSKITSRTGHRTDVDEVVNPAVVQEVVKPHRHEETQEAIDREVHQHHYHTTVQPIAHREVAPEKHVHNVVPQIEREFRHDNEAETARRVSAELSQFKNTQTVTNTTTSTQAAAAVVGEHVHHHVHETVQPVIHKETIRPEVVHTTVPIHEVHVESAQHHGLSALPMKTLDEFRAAGGVLQGSKSHTHEEYDGAPRPYNEKLKTTIDKVLPGHHTTGTTGTTGAGLTGAGLTGTHSGTSGTSLTGTHSSGHHTGALGAGAAGAGTAGALGTTGRHRRGSNSSSSSDESRRRPDSGYSGDRSTRSGNKPSLMDKLNPRVDANGDGQPGFMK
ncbi:hypothetical protein LTR64_003999 [Lithohypha guttulata]|uniref:uncharacterized protein n=1 Tax=Lithohypha guttulata TaxID=1690604 RepID=UPI002DDFE0FB|nr:hypothetical protein LTR51_006706 [Lithohypha guttulata]